MAMRRSGDLSRLLMEMLWLLWPETEGTEE